MTSTRSGTRRPDALLILTLASSATVAGGCSDALTPLVDAFPTGSYEVRIDQGDIRARTELAQLPGTWRITFGADRRLVAARDDGFEVRGSFTATSIVVSLAVEEGAFTCAEVDESVTYYWRLIEDRLFLGGPDKAACEPVGLLFTRKPLTRVE